jgi:hypothetical protein
MKNISTTGDHSHEGSSISHAAILAAPLWASGLVFLAVLFAITKHGQFFSLQFLAMSVAIVLGSTLAALRVMDRDLQNADAQHARGHLRLKLRSRRLHGARLI